MQKVVKNMDQMKKVCFGLICAMALPISAAQADALNVNQNGTLVELCASAQQEVENDAANVQISFKSEQRDKRIAADEVNKRMSAVMQKVKAAYPNIRVANQNYNTYQQYTSKGQSKDWTVEQSFTLESKNPKEVPALVSMVQEEGVTLSGMNAFLTPQATRVTQEKLYKAAFDDVRLRLSAMASAMSRPNTWQITHIETVGQRGCGGGGQYMSMMAARAPSAMPDEASKVSQPTFETEKQMVQLSLWVAAKMK